MHSSIQVKDDMDIT